MTSPEYSDIFPGPQGRVSFLSSTALLGDYMSKQGQLLIKQKGKITKAYKSYSDAVNRPIIVRDALSRGLQVPSQKLYTDISLLNHCIDAVKQASVVINKQLSDADELQRLRDRKAAHTERYRRRPELAKTDPKTFTMGQRIKKLKARQKTIMTLLSELQSAHRALTKADPKPNRNKR